MFFFPATLCWIHPLVSSDSGSSQLNHSPAKETGKNAILLDIDDEIPEDLDSGVQKPKNRKQTAFDSSQRPSTVEKTGKPNQDKDKNANEGFCCTIIQYRLGSVLLASSTAPELHSNPIPVIQNCMTVSGTGYR